MADIGHRIRVAKNKQIEGLDSVFLRAFNGLKSVGFLSKGCRRVRTNISKLKGVINDV